MSSIERLALLVGCCLASVGLTGLLARRQWRASWGLPAYLSAVCGADLLMGLWPERFFHFWSWLIAEAAFTACRFAIAIELAWRIFGRLPRARAWVQAGLLAILGGLAWAVFPLPPQPGDLITMVAPRFAYAEAAAFAWLTACVVWYNLPLHPIHRAILAGLTPYLVLFSAAAHALHELGWQAVRFASAANVWAFLLLLAYWARAAWARDARETTPALLFLQPWRAR